MASMSTTRLGSSRRDVTRSTVHILYIIDSLAPGGAERSLAAMAPSLTKLGLSLDVAYLRKRTGVEEELVDAGARVWHLAGGGRIGWVRRARNLIGQLRPNLVHTTLFESDVVGRAAATVARVPVVTSLVNTTYGPEHYGDPALKWWKLRGAQILDGITARRAVRFHAISHHVADVMAKRLRIHGIPIDVVERGRDPEALGTRSENRRRRVRDALGIAPERPVVVCAARQTHQKGVDVLVDAFGAVERAVPGALLLLAGRDGDATARIQASAERLAPGRIEMLGVRDDVPDLLAAADAFVLPSRWEGLGSVLLEAMAVEVPIVASSLPAVGEILQDDRTALLVPPEDRTALADALVRTMTRPSEARVRAERARQEFLTRFTIERVSERMAAFYDRALAGSF